MKDEVTINLNQYLPITKVKLLKNSYRSSPAKHLPYVISKLHFNLLKCILLERLTDVLSNSSSGNGNLRMLTCRF